MKKTSLSPSSTISRRIVHLTPPLLGAEHIKENIVCIRAHRERLFEVSTQSLDGKVFFHNYGQGGAGWTFLFGCVNESIRQFERHSAQHTSLNNKPVVVIGAGCYGLLTAIILARKGHSVRIVAKDTEHIPSNKAAGFFFPRARKSSTPQELAVFMTTGMESYGVYKQIIQGEHPFIKAVPKLLPAYSGLDIDPGFAPYIAQGIIETPERVTIDFGNGKMYEMMAYETIFINPSVIMQELRRAISELGIPITKAEIGAFGDVSESIIFNCAGMGAKKLACDARIVPVQGHLIALKNQPDVEQLQYMINDKVVMVDAQGRPRDELVYFAPKESGILGITFIRGEDSLTKNHHEFERLLQRSRDYFGT